jgi:RNA polymerase sigma-70 factor (ECF subfamily)
MASKSTGSELEDIDSHLLTRIRAGDTDALARLADIHRDRFCGFVKRIGSDGLLARIEPEDLVQEAIGGAIRFLSAVADEQLDPLPWLFGLLRRRVIDAHRFHFAAGRRDAGRQQSLDAAFGSVAAGGLANLLADSMTTPSAALSRNIKISRVRRAIDTLDPERRDLICWRFVEGLPTKEIAQRMGKSDASVRVMLTRTLRSLEKILES